MLKTWKKYSGTSFLALGIALFLIEPAMAQSLGNIESMLDNIVNMLTGKIARSIAIIAVIIVGFAWQQGRIDLNKAAAIIFGIAIVFGAPQIVSMLQGG